ncbi:MAG TPA: hypothetical protein VMY35_08040 [Phycisphaerae bacterium]|nr:hypothetical protein [Phycisphaerae bacterium]
MAERSFEIVARARDEASAAFSKINKKIISDQRRLSDMQADVTLEGKDKELHGVEKRLRSMADRYKDNANMMAQITRTGMLQRQSIEEKYAREAIEREKKIAEAAAAGKRTMTDGFKALIPHIAAATLALGAVRVGIGAVGVAFANAKLNQALFAGGYEEIKRAQLAVMDANADMVRGIPILGNTIAAAMRRFGDREGIEQAIKNIQEVQQATKKYEEMARQWARETELERARLRGASAAEIMRIEGKQADEKRRSELTAARLTEAKASHAVADQQQVVRSLSFRAQDVFKYQDEKRALDDLIKTHAAAILQRQNLETQSAAKTAAARESAAKQELQERNRLAESHLEYQRGVTARMLADIKASDEKRQQSFVDAERKIRDEQKKTADEAERAGVRRAADEAALNDTVLKSGETARETELRHSKDHYFELWKLYKDDAEMQAAIIKASVADIGMINAKHDKKPDDKKPDAPTPGGPMSRDLGQMQSHRFLRNAPGALDPLWAKTQIDLQQKMLAALENLEKKEPITVVEEGVS